MKAFTGFTKALYELEEARAGIQPDLVAACKQPSESNIIQKRLIP